VSYKAAATNADLRAEIEHRDPNKTRATSAYAASNAAKLQSGLPAKRVMQWSQLERRRLEEEHEDCSAQQQVIACIAS
jgi:hypothetical protein